MIPYDLKLIVRWCDEHDRRGYHQRKDVLAVQFETFVTSVRGMVKADLERQAQNPEWRDEVEASTAPTEAEMPDLGEPPQPDCIGCMGCGRRPTVVKVTDSEVNVDLYVHACHACRAVWWDGWVPDSTTVRELA